MVLKKRVNVVHSEEAEHAKEENDEVVPPVVPIEEEDEEPPCFFAFLLRIKTWFAPLNNMSDAYFEAQRPGYTERPCTDTLPQKPSADNPRNRSPFYRNR